MKLLAWLTESFITTFGITRPRPEQQRTAQMLIGGFLIAFVLVVVSITAFFFFQLHATHAH
jgi:hypothetical protein